MCGIFCLVSDCDEYCAEEFKHVEKLLRNRGVNANKTIYKHQILFNAAVLWQQGDQPCIQPLENDTGNVILLFNGDLYMEILENSVKSDTEYLFDLIKKCETEDELLDVFRIITGPFSIICYFQSKLYFARDSLGRNSLLVGKIQDKKWFLSSVLDSSGEPLEAIELPPLGVYSYDITTKNFKLYPYQNLEVHEHYKEQFSLVNNFLSDAIELSATVILPHWMNKPNDNEFNFSFDNLELENNEQLFERLLQHPEVLKACDTFINLLSQSVKNRVERRPNFCKDCITSMNTKCQHCKLGILFSGGVDCTLIAVLADKFLDKSESIDLMNVSFEKASNKNPNEINWNVPDRLTGLQTLQDLQILLPDRKWNFVEINIDRKELNENMKKLSSLVFPLNNILDESLGAALYFASRGQGITEKCVNYSSPCRVLLIGSGADELFGGYTRHRNAYRRRTPEHDLLKEELALDWVRLPGRNLARDDRVIGDNGITVRAPFIEENFVNFVQRLAPLQRCYPELEPGIGDKLLLRLCAYKLGLTNCCQLKKRALQFGSRIADSRQNAKDKSTFLNQK
ncbi:unnamed protein product [Diamesa hyperborea]